MNARIRDPELLFRGQGASAQRVEQRWVISVWGPAASDEVGGWYPRDDLGEGEWLWVWKWAPIYEADFAHLGEWVFSGLAPRPTKEGAWTFEGGALELYWLATSGSRLAVLEEDARGVLHVLEEDGSIELFAFKPPSESAGNSGSVERSTQAVVPWRFREADDAATSGETSRSLFEGLGLLPAYLLASEVVRDSAIDRLKGIRRVGLVLLSCLEATEFECEVSGRAIVRASLPRSPGISPDAELHELAGHVGGLRWAVRGPRERAFGQQMGERVNRVFATFTRRSVAGSLSQAVAGGPTPVRESKGRD